MNLPQSRNARIRSDVGLTNQPVKLTGIPIIEDPNGPNRQIQERYDAMRAAGQSHSISEMLAYRQSPAAQSDREYQYDRGTLEKQFDDSEGIYSKTVINNYTKHMGHPPNQNMIYEPQLVRPEIGPGDPFAFVSDRGDVKRRAEMLNVNVSGAVNHKASEPISDPFATSSSMTGRNKIANDLKAVLKDAYKSKGSPMSDQALEAKHGNHTAK